ncbi:MAG: HPF/RaiA family ribosome-associated protein [Gemmatimonadota bacterium]|nr:HPF/RaiA family ribosome-associated protein [Gemmatimonadota bacterium]
MEIIFHAHRAVISDNMRARAERAVRKLATRVRRAVHAVVRFEQDGPVRRVEVVLNAAGRRALVAEGVGRNYGPALAAAIERIEAQLEHRKRTPKARARQLARA